MLGPPRPSRAHPAEPRRAGGQQPVPEPETVLLFAMMVAFTLCTLWRRGVFGRPMTPDIRT
ncbi:MAG: PEP-CTERM sorting domain-containing protein [Planctomycetes bacterium]|nr:PEP-CTERM sorting domain-containing protein [Planctomycetota bacterium]